MKTQKKLVTSTTRGKPVKEAATTRRTPSPAATITILPGRDEIARRAYELYTARGKTAGNELDDWIQAERELLAQGNGHTNN